MNAVTRFNLTMDASDKEVVSRGAALMGSTMAAFVRTAAKEKARELLDRESRITMTVRDFEAFTQALNGAFQPNSVLPQAIGASRKIKRV